MTGAHVDLHSHVLPGVDDGAPDVETGLAMLRAAAAGGTRTVVATPHQHPGRYPNRADAIRRAHEVLLEARERATAAGEVLPEVLLGAEVHVDSDLPRRLDAGELLTLAGLRHVLLELPDVLAWPDIEQLVFDLHVAGYRPVIAHPERCGAILREPRRLRRLVELGCLAQVTGSSLAGDFGEPCRHATLGLLHDGLVHAVASDAHDMRRRGPNLARAREALVAAFDEATAVRLLESLPAAIVAGEEVVLRPLDAPTRPRDSLWRRVGRRLMR